MQSRNFQPLGKPLSVIGFGTGGGANFSQIPEADALDLLRRSKACGINVFDTAPVYGYGEAEKRVGRAFRDRREDVVLISKGGLVWDDQKRMAIDNRPATIEAQLHQSLRDLQTESIDFYLIHWPDPQVDIRRPMERLARAQEVGKIRFLGLSNSTPEEITRASEVASIQALQNEFHLFQSYPKDALFPWLRGKDIAFFGWGTFDKGILTGRVTPQRVFSPTDVRSHEEWHLRTKLQAKFKAMEAINQRLRKAGHSGLELALGHSLRQNEVTAALCGLRSIGQMESCAEALERLPPTELLEEVEAIAQECLRKAATPS